jgi:hypothetical protein
MHLNNIEFHFKLCKKIALYCLKCKAISIFFVIIILVQIQCYITSARIFSPNMHRGDRILRAAKTIAYKMGKTAWMAGLGTRRGGCGAARIY